MPCPGFHHTPDQLERQKLAWKASKESLLQEAGRHWSLFEAEHQIVVLNKNEVPLRAKGKHRGQPAMGSDIRIRCGCGREETKVLTPKTMANGHLALCKECSYKIGREKSAKARTGTKHTEETKQKMRAWWDSQNGKGTAREIAMKLVIADILGTVTNWDSLVLTTHGSPAEYVDGKRQDIHFVCRNCGAPSKQAYRHIGALSPTCGTCQRSEKWVGEGTLRSQGERDFGDFLKTLGKVVESHKGLIAPYELDFILPDQKVAIEYDGLYWHSEAHKAKDYHLIKTEACEKVGVHLIHVFEDEWLHKQEIVKDRLRHLIIQPSSRRVHARSCIIVKENTKELIPFFNENHLQGWVGSVEAYTARVDGELIAAMTFSPARMGIGAGGDHWELVRFAVKSGVHSPGIASRLLAAFRKIHPTEVILSFADRRWSQGRLYEAIGFKLLRKSPPNYWYLKRDHRFHRLAFRKDRLVAEGFEKEKSEHQIMLERGFLRIWDCGTLVYRLDP